MVVPHQECPFISRFRFVGGRRAGGAGRAEKGHPISITFALMFYGQFLSSSFLSWGRDVRYGHEAAGFDDTHLRGQANRVITSKRSYCFALSLSFSFVDPSLSSERKSSMLRRSVVWWYVCLLRDDCASQMERFEGWNRDGIPHANRFDVNSCRDKRICRFDGRRVIKKRSAFDITHPSRNLTDD